MTRTPITPAVLAILVSWLVICSPPTAAAQDALARAKDLYTSADYDEALEALTDYHPTPDHAIEADEYRAFCLLALGKSADASKIIEQIVAIDPSFLPAENQASPRVQAAFRDVRQRVLPSIVRDAYTEAKSSYDRKDFEKAATQFQRVLALLKDPAAVGVSDLADLRTLSSGFLDLIKTAAAPAPAPAVQVPTAPPPPPAPRVYSGEDADVTPPVAVSQAVPPWRPSKQEAQMYEIAVILLIDETGSVASLRLEGNLPASYEARFREAVGHWKYRPARKNGVPVKFQRAMSIRLTPADAK